MMLECCCRRPHEFQFCRWAIPCTRCGDREYTVTNSPLGSWLEEIAVAGGAQWRAWWNVGATEGTTRDSVRGDAWRCGSCKVVRALSWRKFWNVQKLFPTCHDLSRWSCCTCLILGVTHFVNSSLRVRWHDLARCGEMKLFITLPSWLTSCH